MENKMFQLLTNEKITRLCIEIDHEVYKIGLNQFINENISNNENLQNLFKKLEQELKSNNILLNQNIEIYKKVVMPIIQRYSKQSKNNHYH